MNRWHDATDRCHGRTVGWMDRWHGRSAAVDKLATWKDRWHGKQVVCVDRLHGQTVGMDSQVA